jgi:hypothetical protein
LNLVKSCEINKEYILQRHDDRPPASGRPSLLSAAQQAEAERHRILSTPDQRAAPTAAPRARPSNRGRAGWIAAGVGVLGLASVSALWLGYDDAVSPRLAAIALATTAAAGKGTSGTGTATAAVAGSSPLPGTAAELRDTAPADTAAPEKIPSLHDMLAASATATAKTAVKPRDELSPALGRPASASRQHATPARAEHGELAQHRAPARSGNTAPKAAATEKHHAELAQNVAPSTGEPLKMAQNVAPLTGEPLKMAQNVAPSTGEPLKMAQNVAPQHK